MEYTSQSVLHFPAAYAPISEDEMIYLDGGDAISPQQFTFNLVTNLIRLMGQAAFGNALNGLSNMSNDGLTTGGAIAHYWNRQNTLGKVATVVFTGFAGYAVYIYCVSLVNNVLNLYTSAKNSITGADQTTTDTTAAASSDPTTAAVRRMESFHRSAPSGRFLLQRRHPFAVLHLRAHAAVPRGRLRLPVGRECLRQALQPVRLPRRHPVGAPVLHGRDAPEAAGARRMI